LYSFILKRPKKLIQIVCDKGEMVVDVVAVAVVETQVEVVEEQVARTGAKAHSATTRTTDDRWLDRLVAQAKQDLPNNSENRPSNLQTTHQLLIWFEQNKIIICSSKIKSETNFDFILQKNSNCYSSFKNSIYSTI
jgi:hypothetical protein